MTTSPHPLLFFGFLEDIGGVLPTNVLSGTVARYLCQFLLTCDFTMTHNNDAGPSSPAPEMPPADPAVFSFGAGSARTNGLRTDAETRLGKGLFAQTHTYLIGARGTGDARKSEAEIAAHLEKLSGGKDHLRDGIFIVDQMVYIELHAS